MASSYAMYAVSDDDQPVVDAVALAFPPEATRHDDGSRVTFTWPGRRAAVFLGDLDDPEVSTRQVRQVFVWAGADGQSPAALDVIDALRSRGIEVFVDPAHPDLIAADAARTAAAS